MLAGDGEFLRSRAMVVAVRTVSAVDLVVNFDFLPVVRQEVTVPTVFYITIQV